MRALARRARLRPGESDRKSTRLNSSHSQISYAVLCLKKKIHINATAAIQEISDVLHAAMMSEDAYNAVAATLYDMIGPQGKFSRDVAESLNLKQTQLK